MVKDFPYLSGYVFIFNYIENDQIKYFIIILQNKVFVYRGLEYERMEAFTQRLQTEFPTAQLLTKNSPPSQTILQSDSQC